MQTALNRSACLLLTIAATFHAGAADKPATDPDFKVTGQITAGGESRTLAVIFAGDVAVTFMDDEPSAVINVREHAWHDVASGKRATLDDCKKWHEASRARSLKTLDATPAGPARDFASAMLAPKFEVDATADTIVMKNAVLSYKLSDLEKLSDARAERLSAYSILNAYHTAMTQRQVPPDAAIAVAAELTKRKVYARKMAMTITTPRGPQVIDVTMTPVPLAAGDAEKAEKVRQATAKAGG